MTKWIIVSGPDWYRPSVSSTEQMVRQFKKNGYSVLWINPIAFKSPFINSSNRSSVFVKIKDKLWTHLHWLRRNSQKLWVLVPLYLPLFSNSADRLNRWIVGIQIKLCCIMFNIKIRESVFWISGSFTAETLLDWPFYRKVYEAADLISGFRNASQELKKKLEIREQNLCHKADTVFAASERIAEKLIELCGKKVKVKVLHHGVDFPHFAAELDPPDVMKQIKALGKPIAGYFGSLTDANDKEVFLSLAKNGFTVVIIGKVLGDYTALQEHENIHMLGPIPYSLLPMYAQAFDVGLLNWRMHEWIYNCFPIKALEYLALGLPVVSCKIPVLMKHFGDVISFVETPAEFVEEAKRLVAENTVESIRKRQQVVRNWSWENRFEYVRNVLGLY